MKQYFALLLAFTPFAYAEPTIGRLFMAPEERRQVDLHPERTDAAGNNSHYANRGDEDQITVNGLVTRNNGKRTVWINHQALQEGQSAVSARPIGIPRPGTVEISLPGQSATQLLKAGQSYDQISGTINEGFNKKALSPAPPMQGINAPFPTNTKNAIAPNDFLPPIAPLIGKSHIQSIPSKTAIPPTSTSGRK